MFRMFKRFFGRYKKDTNVAVRDKYEYVGEANGVTFKIISDIELLFEIDYQKIARIVEEYGPDGAIIAKALFDKYFRKLNEKVETIKIYPNEGGILTVLTIELTDNIFNNIS